LRWFFDTPLPKTFTWNLQGEKRFPRVKMEHWDLIPKPENIHYLWDFKILGENLCFYCPPEVAMREQVPTCARASGYLATMFYLPYHSDIPPSNICGNLCPKFHCPNSIPLVLFLVQPIHFFPYSNHFFLSSFAFTCTPGPALLCVYSTQSCGYLGFSKSFLIVF
jgi:hypothetical protein